MTPGEVGRHRQRGSHKDTHMDAKLGVLPIDTQTAPPQHKKVQRKIQGDRKWPELQRRTRGRSLVEHALNFALPVELDACSQPVLPSDAPYISPYGKAGILAPAQYLHLASTDLGETVSFDAAQAVATSIADFSKVMNAFLEDGPQRDFSAAETYFPELADDQGVVTPQPKRRYAIKNSQPSAGSAQPRPFDALASYVSSDATRLGTWIASSRKLAEEYQTQCKKFVCPPLIQFLVNQWKWESNSACTSGTPRVEDLTVSFA